MISTLTKEQEKKIPLYVKKYLKLGYRTKTIDKKKAQKAVNFFYKIAGEKEPKHTIFLDSPMACQLACNLIKGTKLDGKQLRSQLGSQLGSQLRSQLRSQLYSKLYSQLDSQLYSQLDSQLGSQLRSQLRSQLYSKLYSQLDSQLGSQLGSQLDSQLYSQLDSQNIEYFSNSYAANLWYWAGYYGFYDYILNELLPEKREDFKLFKEYLSHFQEVHYIYMFKGICFVSDFPRLIKVNSQGQLHSTDSPALLYRDTYSLYKSNGITMKPEYINTPADKITKEMFLGEENADMVRELIRKIGMDRVTDILKPKVIDTFSTETGGKYELLSINYDKRGERPYLKMKCSSSSEVFILGVKPGITKAVEAWEYLNNGLKFKDTQIVWEA